MLNEWIAGAWQRTGRRIEGGAFDEPSDVYWLCVPPVYADIRLYHGEEAEPTELDYSQAFSGRVHVAGEVVTWEHDLDTTNRYGEEAIDAAPLRGSRDELMEVGDGYDERWMRIESSDSFAAAERHGEDDALSGRVVCVGDRAVAVFSQPAPAGLLFERGPTRLWELAASVGQPAHESIDAAREVVQSLELGQALPPAWRVVASV